MRASRLIALPLVMAGTLAMAACSGQTANETDAAAGGDSCGPLADMTQVSLGVNPGAQDLVVQAIKDQEFDKKYNLDLDVKNFENPPAAAQAVTQKAVDLGFGGVPTMAQARAQGLDVFMFGAVASPSNGVFVPQGSPIKDIGDLPGSKFGSFGATNSATFGVLSAIADEKYGVENLEDELGSLVTAPDAALAGLMDQGELDAVLLGSTATVLTQLEGKLTKIGDLSSEYEEATLSVPVHVALTSTDSYAEGHCSELIAFSNAMRDGVEYVQSDIEGWKEYAETLEIQDPGAPEALQEVLGENFRSTWDEEQVAGISEMLEAFIPILGAEDFISEVPEGLFRMEFVATESDQPATSAP